MGLFDSLDSVSEEAVVITVPDSTHQVVGRLRFDPNSGTTLELIDTTAIFDPHKSLRKRLSIIHGTLLNKVNITLLQCKITDINGGFSPIVKVAIRADRLVTGIHLTDPSSKLFDEIRVTAPQLNEWLALPTIQPERPLDELPATPRRYGLNFTPESDFSIHSQGGPILSSSQVVSICDNNNYSQTLSIHGYLNTRRPEPIELDACDSELFSLQAFISLLCGQQVFFQSIRLYRHDLDPVERHLKSVEYLPTLQRPEKTPRNPPQVFVSRKSIGDALKQLWSNWQNRYTTIRSSVELFCATDMAGVQLPEFRFMNMMQALEAFHRAQFPGTYMSAQDYAQIESAMSGAIPDAVTNDHRAALRSRIKYGNEHSLRKRLRDLEATLPRDASACIHRSLRDFLDRAVDTRNQLIHSGERTSGFSNGLDLHHAEKLLRWFLAASILHDLQLPENTLTEALANVLELNLAKNHFETLSKPS